MQRSPIRDPGLTVSIVIPSLNQGRYLESAIQSVLNQEYPRLECIVIDGGSTDGSAEIIRRHSSRLAYWVSEADSGQTDALAKGFSVARGEVLGWLNSDDVLLPGSIRVVARALERDPGAVAVSGRCVYISARGEPIGIHVPIARSFRGMLWLGAGVAQPATFWRANALRSVGGIRCDLSYSFDYDLFLRMRRLGRFAVLSDCLAAFRLHPSSKTQTEPEKFAMEDRQILRRYLRHPTAVELCMMLHRLNPASRMRNALQWARKPACVTELLRATLSEQASDYR
jgi:glycosyltransferase involved in cell wall biosynthesis